MDNKIVYIVFRDGLDFPEVILDTLSDADKYVRGNREHLSIKCWQVSKVDDTGKVVAA